MTCGENTLEHRHLTRTTFGTDPARIDKDGALDRLATKGNVAQFVSFAPGGGGARQRFSRIRGREPNHVFAGLEEAASALLAVAGERSVNVRSYAPDDARSREFVYGLKDAAEAVAAARRLLGDGLNVIFNETIDVRDGGVSGVAHGDVVEFSPDDTPRCVERPGTASLPRAWALAILETVYDFAPDFGDGRGRLEFSLHPAPRGWRGSHTILWEHEDADPPHAPAALTWPNAFSRLLGDKAFGLLIAERLGLPVPATTLVGRRAKPFRFGRPTGSPQIWIRTCPAEADPGRFTTRKDWIDPFELLAGEDPDHEIASVLCQAAVPAAFSGAAVVTSDGALAIEGVAGEGDRLMVGAKLPEQLPRAVTDDVEAAYAIAAASLGPVRFEWVHDGTSLWIVQLHRGATSSTSRVLVPGEARKWIRFEATSGLAALRHLIATLRAGDGLVLVGDVGVTSHLADLVRRSGVPTRIGSE